MEQPFLTYTGEPPNSASLLIKRLSEKNAVAMRGLSIAEQREARERLADVRLVLPGVAVDDLSCAGVPCRFISLKEGGYYSKVILYLHGGGWIFNSIRTAKAFGVFLAESTGCKVLLADYRLAPENPYPAGLDDCFAVYQWLLTAGYKARDIALFGDSAGGNLCFCLLTRLKALGYELPACVGAASPVTDARESSAIAQSEDNLIYTRYEDIERDIFTLYAADHDRGDPQISPICGDLEGFPPIMIHSGGAEPITADNIAFGEKAYGQGVAVQVRVFADMFHNFTIVGRALKESRQSVAELADFYREHLLRDNEHTNDKDCGI